jgi:hypothetical protein
MAFFHQADLSILVVWNSGNWTFPSPIYEHELDSQHLCCWLLNIPGFISPSIFFWVCYSVWSWSSSHSCTMGKFPFSFFICWLFCGDLLYLNTVSLCHFGNTLTCHVSVLWLVQFNNILNVFFGSPVIITILVATVLDLTLTRHVTKRDRGRLWIKRFKGFHDDPRNYEFYRLPFGLHRMFPPTTWLKFLSCELFFPRLSKLFWQNHRLTNRQQAKVDVNISWQFSALEDQFLICYQWALFHILVPLLAWFACLACNGWLLEDDVRKGSFTWEMLLFLHAYLH